MPNQNALDAANLLHLGLLQVDSQTGRYTSSLADTLPRVQFIGDSLTRLDYHLRAAATWDDGRPVVATDVEFTLKLMYCPGLPNEYDRAEFSFIRQLIPDPADPRHFTLVCRGQAPEYATTSGDFPILPEAPLDPTHSLRQVSLAALQDQPPTATPAPAVAALVRRYQQADLGRHPERLAGCGPYRLLAWETGRYLTLQRKSNWWGGRLHPAPLVLQAQPKQLQFVILPSDAAATLALRRHELDLYPQVPARDFQRLQASATAQREFAFYSGISYDIVTVGFNTRQAILSDRLTRQALSCLLDVAGLLAATQLGYGQRTVGLLPPTSPYYNDSLPLLTYAPARAVALLRQAGWQQMAGGWQRATTQRLALSVRYRADEATFETVALQFRAAAAKLGIPVTLRPTEAFTLTKALRQGDFDVYVRTLKGNPFAFNFTPILHSQSVGQGNFTGFGTPATDHLIEAIAAVGPPARKRLLLRRFQAMLQQEAPLVPLFFLPYRLVADRHLSQVFPSGLKPGYAAAALTWTTTSAN